MQGKIALEEHFGATEPDIISQAEEHFTPQAWPEKRRQLLDLQDERLQAMDQAGIGLSVLSLLAPGIQALYHRDQAIDWARRLNDFAADQVSRRPDRFAAFAALPLQDPEVAAIELRRAVTTLGMKGALVNGFSQVGKEDTIAYLDEPQYRAFWATVSELDVPVYLHPRDPLPRDNRACDGHPWLRGSAWAFSIETGTHALRLMGSGLFDAYPKVQIILGHFGELLPFNIWRTDHRLGVAPRGIQAQKPFSHYLCNNFYLTTSGNFRTPALHNVLTEVGADRVMFASDYPYESMLEASEWFDRVALNATDHAKIASGNARRLLKL